MAIWSSINPSTTSGTDLATLLDSFKNTVVSGFKATSRPTNLLTGGYWFDTTNEGSPNFYWSYKVYDGSNDVELFRFDLAHSKIILPGTTASRIVSTNASNNITSLEYDAANTANAIVQRNGSGGFSMGVLNASGASVSGLTASQAVVTDGSKNLASLAYATANTASAIVARDGSGNFAAGTITAALTGTASGNTTIASPANHGVMISGSANAMTATAAGTAGQVLKSGGASADPVWGAFPALKHQEFTSSGANTFTIPAGTVSTTIFEFILTGGGAGGGGAATGAGCAGAGGGAAGTCIKYLTGLTAGNTIIVTIGTGGAGGNSSGGNGADGVDSTLTSGTETITTVTAPKGLLGAGLTTVTTGLGGAGGVPSTGDVNIRGGGGTDSFPIAGNTAVAGTGGASFWGGGGAGRAAGSDGIDGAAYGSGGSGGATNAGNRPGGAGRQGFGMVRWIG